MKFALSGRIVTMNPQRAVHDHGTIYVDGRAIVAVDPHGAPRPPGFDDCIALDTGGTIYPGLIELHNHLPYDVLVPWQVDRKYENRNQWQGTAQYHAAVTTPMTVLARIPELVPAIARYTEAKCLLAGTTTSQGIALFSNQGVQHFYRGLVRNVEQTYDAELPEARCRIEDLQHKEVAAFLERLKRTSCFLLHLSEGCDEAARSHFLTLQMAAGWAITPALSGIHCNALTRGDFETMASHGASMVWSPVSNYLLYGATADVTAARAAGLRIGIGSDWSYSGSKNLLAELGVARLAADGAVADGALVAMATCDAAAILGWSGVLGSLESHKWADLIVVRGNRKDPYEQLLTASETDLEFTMIDGIPRCGTPAHMTHVGASGETVVVGSEARIVAAQDPDADPVVQAMSLRRASTLLGKALRDLPRLALDQSKRQAAGDALHLLAHSRAKPMWFLALDQAPPPGAARRRSPRTLRVADRPARATLDALTTAGDSHYYERLASQVNLPAPLRDRIRDRFL